MCQIYILPFVSSFRELWLSRNGLGRLSLGLRNNTACCIAQLVRALDCYVMCIERPRVQVSL